MEDTKNSSLTTDTAKLPELTSESAANLLTAAKWGKFLAILGFIMTSLLIIAGIMMSFVLNSVKDEMIPLNMPFSPKILSFFYVAVAAISMIPVIFLNSFSNNAVKAVKFSDTEKMTASMKNLKNLFVFLGISTIVMIALYVIVLLTIGTAAIFSF
jgi:hypothetical protein